MGCDEGIFDNVSSYPKEIRDDDDDNDNKYDEFKNNNNISW